ncbi:MAG: hypothetical protein AAFY15_14095, partial [Cyanobacteria bacterium J06648_11]
MKRFEWMRRTSQVGLVLSLATLTSCGLFERWQSGDLQTDRVAGRDVPCEAAIAKRTHAWQVRYVIDRATRDTQPEDRVETFARRTLAIRNGQPPATNDAVNVNEEWWPPVPPRPEFSDIEAQRRSLERADMPSLEKRAEFFLECEVGELSASDRLGDRSRSARLLRTPEKT